MMCWSCPPVQGPPVTQSTSPGSSPSTADSLCLQMFPTASSCSCSSLASVQSWDLQVWRGGDEATVGLGLWGWDCMIRYDIICHEMVWYYIIWHDMTWFTMICHALIWNDIILYYMTINDTTWYDVIRYVKLVWHDLTLYGILLYEIPWHELTLLVKLWYDQSCAGKHTVCQHTGEDQGEGWIHFIINKPGQSQGRLYKH